MARKKGGARAAGSGSIPRKVPRQGRGWGGVKVKRRFHSHAPSVAVYARVQEAYLKRIHNKEAVNQAYSCEMLRELQNADTAARAAGTHAPCSDTSADEMDKSEDESSDSDQKEEPVKKIARPVVKQYARRMRSDAVAGSSAATSAAASSSRPLSTSTAASGALISTAAAANTRTEDTHSSINTAATIVRTTGTRKQLDVTVNADGGDDGSSSSSSSSEDSSIPEGEFVVEKIIGMRVTADKKLLYYVKWAGYPSSENTWEPLSNLANAQLCIARFDAKLARI